MSKIRLVIPLLTVAFLPGMLAGQYSSHDAGQYVILSAQYGTARRHVDVSNRLKELARQDRPFRMGNSTFGVDPDRGQVKALRIYARGPDGRERMFEYREGSTVDGSQFRGWSRGDWGMERWSGRWEGGDNGRNDGDSGQYVIHERPIRHGAPTRGREQSSEGTCPPRSRLPHGKQHFRRRP